MTIFRRASAGLVVSGVLTLGLFYAPALTYADFNAVKLVNVKTGKCLTIAGGVSTENVTAIQFDCDSDPSRTWRIIG
jgi:cytolethal distending toxin subunit A